MKQRMIRFFLLSVALIFWVGGMVNLSTSQVTKKNKNGDEIFVFQNGMEIEKSRWKSLQKQGSVYRYQSSEHYPREKHRWIELVFFSEKKQITPFTFESILYQKTDIKKGDTCGSNGRLVALGKNVFRIRMVLGCDRRENQIAYGTEYRIRGLDGNVLKNKTFTTPEKKDIERGEVRYIPIRIGADSNLTDRRNKEQNRSKGYSFVLNNFPEQEFQNENENIEERSRIYYVGPGGKYHSLHRIQHGKYGTKSDLPEEGAIFLYRIVFKPPENEKKYDFPDGYVESRELLYVINDINSEKVDKVDFTRAEKAYSHKNAIRKTLDLSSVLPRKIKESSYKPIGFVKRFQVGEKQIEKAVIGSILLEEDSVDAVPLYAVPGTYKLIVTYKESTQDQKGEEKEKVISESFQFPPGKNK